MDKTTPQKHLLEAALDALRAHGIEVDILGDEAAHGLTRADAIVRIGHGPGTTVFAAEVKRHVTAATLGAVTDLLRQQPGKPPLLITDYITPPVADRLKANRLAFIDAAGNAFIDQPGNFVWVKGNRPKNKLPLAKQTVTRAFEPAGLKVLFAFLCDPALANCPFREIADKAGVAHGTVGEVMAELTPAGFIYDPRRQRGGRKLRQMEQLLANWAAAFARKLKPKLFVGRYRARDANWWKELDPTKYGLVLGAEPAAARITGYLKPAVITLYGERVQPRLIVDYALRTDPDGDVEIAKRFWRVETEETKKGLAPLPLVYADLLATGDPRCIETAGLAESNTLLDLSHKAELVWLGRLLGDVRAAAPEADFLVAGAQARDLLLKHAHGIETGRATEDVDLAFLVASWDEFMSLHKCLLDSGKFITETRTLHELSYTGVGKARLDLIPFAGIETDDRHIRWPPNGETVMNVIGFRETHAAAVQVVLPETQQVAVAALHALMLLKLSAWKDRRLQHPMGKDAHDIRLLLKTYLDAGNQERLYSEAAYLLDRADFDYEVTGAWLLGYDAGNLLLTEETPGNAKVFYRTLLRTEVEADMESMLINDMRTPDPAADVRLLRSLFEGYCAGARP